MQCRYRQRNCAQGQMLPKISACSTDTSDLSHQRIFPRDRLYSPRRLSIAVRACSMPCAPSGLLPQSVERTRATLHKAAQASTKFVSGGHAMDGWLSSRKRSSVEPDRALRDYKYGGHCCVVTRSRRRFCAHYRAPKVLSMSRQVARVVGIVSASNSCTHSEFLPTAGP